MHKIVKYQPCGVAVNHSGLWSRRRQFESAQGYAAVAQLGERQTEDLEVACSSHARGTFFLIFFLLSLFFTLPPMIS